MELLISWGKWWKCHSLNKRYVGSDNDKRSPVVEIIINELRAMVSNIPTKYYHIETNEQTCQLTLRIQITSIRYVLTWKLQHNNTGNETSNVTWKKNSLWKLLFQWLSNYGEYKKFFNSRFIHSFITRLRRAYFIIKKSEILKNESIQITLIIFFVQIENI